MNRQTADAVEAAFVGAVLTATVVTSHNMLNDGVSAGAVFLSFLCSQAAFVLADETRNAGQRELSRRYRHLYLAKEGFWIATCILLKSAPLIASTILFASYPFWRTALREPERARAKLRQWLYRVKMALRQAAPTASDDSLHRSLLCEAE